MWSVLCGLYYTVPSHPSTGPHPPNFSQLLRGSDPPIQPQIAPITSEPHASDPTPQLTHTKAKATLLAPTTPQPLNSQLHYPPNTKGHTPINPNLSSKSKRRLPLLSQHTLVTPPPPTPFGPTSHDSAEHTSHTYYRRPPTTNRPPTPTNTTLMPDSNRTHLSLPQPPRPP